MIERSESIKGAEFLELLESLVGPLEQVANILRSQTISSIECSAEDVSRWKDVKSEIEDIRRDVRHFVVEREDAIGAADPQVLFYEVFNSAQDLCRNVSIHKKALMHWISTMDGRTGSNLRWDVAELYGNLKVAMNELTGLSDAWIDRSNYLESLNQETECRASRGA